MSWIDGYIRGLWKHLLTYFQRHYKDQKVTYFLTLELNQKGYAHINVLIDKTNINRTWLRNAWTNLGGGSRLYVRPIQFSYKIARYVTKDFIKGKLPSNVRRHSSSQDIKINLKKTPHGKNDPWRRIPYGQIQLAAHNAPLKGLTVKNLRHTHGYIQSLNVVHPK